MEIINHKDKHYLKTETGYREILASTDKSLTKKMYCVSSGKYQESLPQPSQAFIQKFVEEYNKGNIITEIMVEYEEYKSSSYQEGWNMVSSKGEVVWNRLKVNPKDNTITIKKVKDSWNREEVINLLKLQYNEFAAYPMMNLDLRDRWIEKNL